MVKEMRVTARLLSDGLTEAEASERILSDNLFQYPTEKNIKRSLTKSMERLNLLDSVELVSRIADENSEATRQMCLYSMMKFSRLVWDFMVSVIGEKYRMQDSVFGQEDINVFFTRLREQDDAVASWSDRTIKEYKRIIIKSLVECGYLDGPDSARLNYILIDPALERAIRANGDSIALPAFNCLGGSYGT